MPNYVWTVKDRHGDRYVKEVAAESAEAAKEQLIAEGCTELQLEEGELEDAFKDSMPNPKIFDEKIQVTAAQRLVHRNKPPKSYWTVLSEGLGQTKGLCIFVLLLAAFETWRGNYWSAALAGVGLIFWLGFLVTMGLPSIYFQRLNKAAEWNRWNEVLDEVENLKLINRFHIIKVPAFYLAKSQASAMAALGDLKGALAVFAPYENQPGCPGWMHKLFTAGIYDRARQYDQGVKYTLLSIAEKPTSTSSLDLANRYLRNFKDPVQARQALTAVANTTLSGNEQLYFHRCRGILAWLEGDFPGAKNELKTAVELMERIKNAPGIFGIACVTKAFLCCALARQGELPAAQKYFTEAKEYLIATDEADLIKECEQALGDSN